MEQTNVDLEPVSVDWYDGQGHRRSAKFVVEGGEYLGEVLRETGRFYEDDLLNEIAGFALGDGLVVDVGANIGNHSVFFAKMLGRRVMAFEPHPTIAERLRTNIDLNDVQTSVTVHQVGLLDRRDWCSMRFDPDNWGRTAIDEAPDGEQVYVARLDDFVTADAKVALIKVDVEGVEHLVLAGAMRLLRRDLPMIVAEAHSRLAQQRISELLDPLGYVPVTVLGRSDNVVFASPERHSSAIAAGHVRAARYVTRNLRPEGALSHTHAIPVLAELDRLKAFNQTLGANKAAQVGRLRRDLRSRDREIRRLQAQVQTALGHYSHLYYDVLSKRQRRGQTVPRDQRREVYAAEAEPEAPRPSPIARSDDDRLPYLSVQLERDRPVRVGMAAIPSRLETLKVTIASLRPQVDEIYVSLNGFERIPDGLCTEGVHAVLNPDGGDQAKFMFLDDDFDGYYLTCDDDIEYPPFYVNSLLYYLQKYDGRAAVGWHGSTLQRGGLDYYDPEYRQVRTFRSRQLDERFVQFLGTGCMAIDTAHVRPPSTIFESSSMADIYFALYAQQHEVPLVLVPHAARQARDLTEMLDDASSISSASIDRTKSHIDMRDRVNDLIAGHTWQTHTPPTVTRVSMVGRFDPNRWHKGGIAKSCTLMRQQLQQLGCHVDVVDLDAPFDQIERLVAGSYDIGFVYGGDQRAQDYFNLRRLLETRPSAAFPVYFNLSYDGSSQRTEEIRQISAHMPRHYGTFAFTEAAARHLESVTGRRSLVVPKTIEMPDVAHGPQESTDRAGIFCGDIAKFLKPELTPDAEALLAVLAARMPLNDLHFVEQYGAESMPWYAHSFTLHPHSSRVHELIRRRRIYVHMNRFCTFEMLPVEALALGIPVVYCVMPQSLDEYIGDAGIPFDSPDELADAIARLDDDDVYAEMARRSRERADELGWRSSVGRLAEAIADGRAGKRVAGVPTDDAGGAAPEP